MKMLKKVPGHLYFIFFGALLFSAPAQAYLDPGTVTYVISMVAAIFIAAGAALAIFRRKVKLFFQNLGKKKNTDAAEKAVDDETELNPMDDVIDPMDSSKH